MKKMLSRDRKDNFSTNNLQGPLGEDTKIYILTKQNSVSSAIDHIFLYANTFDDPDSLINKLVADYEKKGNQLNYVVFIDFAITETKDGNIAQKIIHTILHNPKLKIGKNKISILMITDSESSIKTTLQTDATGYVCKPILKEDWIHRVKMYVKMGIFESNETLREKLLPERRESIQDSQISELECQWEDLRKQKILVEWKLNLLRGQKEGGNIQVSSDLKKLQGKMGQMQKEGKLDKKLEIIFNSVNELNQNDLDPSNINRIVSDFENNLKLSGISVDPRETFVESIKNVDVTVKDWLVSNYSNASFDDIYSDISNEKETKYKRRNSLFINVENTDMELTLQLVNWDFNIFEYSENPFMLNKILFNLFSSWGFFEMFHIPENVFFNFIQKVRENYNDNPYHNFLHAIDVLQTVHCILTNTNIINHLRWIDVFGLYISALCHDLDHGGKNNMFHMQTKSNLALFYNDISILENHHAAKTFEILMEKESNITVGLDEKEYTELRQTIINSILGTDMSFHAQFVGDLKNKLTNTFPSEPIKREDQLFIMKLILHAADISNPSKAFYVSSNWTNRLVEEFSKQGDTEKELGMQVNPMMDRSKLKKGYTMTKGFIEFVVQPYFVLLAQLMPELSFVVKNLEENKEVFKQLEENDK
eukprot:TRINITY_DN5072_c0_g2_i2.p1 TRINITY_DN5072_c0_g2~~TRINITY_DN5072_c0_g2_i2.p1  ORF type:complete len:651 (+),score=191.39 TRINITY_DN5072_c0_g2_i2:44-1996(+)